MTAKTKMTAQEALREAMETSGLRTVDVASKVGVNINTVYKVLNGGRPSRLTLDALIRLVPGFSDRYGDAA
jgi:predicted transcriptional regulator